MTFIMSYYLRWLYLLDAVFEGLLGQTAGALHRLAIVVGSPAGAVDVHVVGVEPDGAGLNGISHDPIQHPNA